MINTLVTLQFKSITHTTSQYTIVTFCNRWFSLSQQHYAQICSHLSTFYFNFCTIHCIDCFGSTTILQFLSAKPSRLWISSPFPLLQLALLSPSCLCTLIWPFTLCLCLSLCLPLWRPTLHVLLSCWCGCRTPYNPQLVSCQPRRKGLPVVYKRQALRNVFKISTSMLLSKQLPVNEN